MLVSILGKQIVVYWNYAPMRSYKHLFFDLDHTLWDLTLIETVQKHS